MVVVILTECKLRGCESVRETVCSRNCEEGDPKRYHPLLSSRTIGGRDIPATGTVGREGGIEATEREREKERE